MANGDRRLLRIRLAKAASSDGYCCDGVWRCPRHCSCTPRLLAGLTGITEARERQVTTVCLGVTRGTRALRYTTRVGHRLNGDCDVEVERNVTDS
jgi:hypothetical protein